MKDKTVARVTIYNAASFTRRARTCIAWWLMRQAWSLMRNGHEYTKGRFTARYLVSDIEDAIDVEDAMDSKLEMQRGRQ